jgi:hypothetical protein
MEDPTVQFRLDMFSLLQRGSELFQFFSKVHFTPFLSSGARNLEKEQTDRKGIDRQGYAENRRTANGNSEDESIEKIN